MRRKGDGVANEEDDEQVEQFSLETHQDLFRHVRKLVKDVYFGDGKENLSVTTRLALMERDMLTVKEGVSNFRKFQERGTRYFDRAEGAMDLSEKNKSRNWKLLGFAAPFILAAVIWVGNWGVTVIKNLDIVLQIEQEWKQAHPSEFVAPQQMFDDHHQEQAKNELAY